MKPGIVKALLLTLVLTAGCRFDTPRRAGELGPSIEGEVTKVVSLAPSLSNLVIALGASHTLVGVTRFDEAPEVAGVTRVGGYNDPSLETIVRLAPDVVVCQPSPGNKGAVHAVADAGIPVRFFGLESLADVRSTTLALGTLLDREEAANTLVARMDEARQKARAAAERRARRPKVVLLVGIEPLMAAGPGSFSHELLEDAGGENVVGRSAQRWPQLSPERLIAQRPDAVLFVGVNHGADPARLPASLQDRVVVLSSPGLLQPGAGAIEALEELTRVFDRLVATP